MTLSIFCLGDSNTWGYVPGSLQAKTGEYDQYDAKDRWPCILKQALIDHGVECHIVEDAVPGRTVNIDHINAPELNGLSWFKDHYANDIVNYDVFIIALGVNDLKCYYSLSSATIAQNILTLSLYINKKNPRAKVIVVLPPVISKEDGFGSDFSGALKKSIQLRSDLVSLLDESFIRLFDLSYELNKIDGIHFSINDNKNLALELKEKLMAEIKDAR